MAHAYTPGLQVLEQTRYKTTRALPIAGDVLVQPGQRVTAEQVVARTQQPGDVTPLNLAHQLSIPGSQVPRALRRRVGERVEAGELLAESSGIFGYFKKAALAPSSGTIESVSQVTGQVILRSDPRPVEVKAFVAGEVVEILPQAGVVIETPATFLQGIFGVGGEQVGRLELVGAGPQADFGPDLLEASHAGAVVAGGRRIHGATVARAQELGVRGLISGGIDDQDLKDILGYDLGVAITGGEALGLSIIITEGFGEIAMADRTWRLLEQRRGQQASIHGATQIRAGVLRPEIVIPLPLAASSLATAARIGGGLLEIGSPVRLIRDPYFGELGEVIELPTQPQLLESGSKARVVEVRRRTGGSVIVPRANVELIGD